MHWFLPQFFYSLLSMLSFSITFADVWTVDKSKYLFFIAFLPSGENIFPSKPHVFFYKPAKPVITLLNIITQVGHGTAVSRHQLNKSHTSIAPLNVEPTNISFVWWSPCIARSFRVLQSIFSICMPPLRRGFELKSYRRLACFGFWSVYHPHYSNGSLV